MVAKEKVAAWIAQDPEPRDVAALEGLLEQLENGGDQASAAQVELDDAFAGELRFGTAGLRGKLGAGPNRMNRAVVIRAAAGLCAYLKEKVGPDFEIVIGYDARYGSKQFAEDTAAVAVAAGGRAKLFPRSLPTPVTAYALKYLGADAAVMVTASHNPPQDNGYKVYLGGRAISGSGQGAQIVPPADAEIYAQIQSAAPANEVPLAESGWEMIGEDLWESYIAQGISLATPGSKDLKIVLTSMHGVGGETCLRVLNGAGFKDIHVVNEQQEPNPDFPTVAFPNPEEPGAMDLALELAASVGADLVLANDPDADRCSAAIADVQNPGKYRQLAGDEIGALLGWQAAEFWSENAQQREADGLNMFGPGTTGTLACSIVSSRLLSQIAQSHQMNFQATLTGFKWISRTENLVFGYEEAIGFCVDPQHVRDKDGITACVRLASLAQELKREGRTLQDVLDDLAREHGLYLTSPLSIRVENLALIQEGLKNLKERGVESLAGSKVVEFADLSTGYQGLPGTDGFLILTEAQDRVIVRPSGTEPKLKCYLEVILPVDQDADLTQVRQEAQSRLAQMKVEIRQVLGI
ncbi:phosphomannomutase [Boudabousia liubingyangii]|uniref:phospho-sugar mutase n=1 Tax=Boudabousia liubingyangii TaxID=1921764 RepID=UPI00093C8F73|nr:phospho-sugar mutase [Boudabousia liubingyangii]OKL46319.1 phosphomannomutase [Boudabousia liubingyangii]